MPKTPMLDRPVGDYLASGRARGFSLKTIRYAEGSHGTGIVPTSPSLTATGR